MVGILASIMGVGGAFMTVPMMVYLLGMPAHVAVGTSLFQTLFTCAGVTYMQSTANHTVDLVLALLLAAGSTVGAQIGARLTRFLRGDQLLIILATLALVVVVKMVVGVLVTPSNLLTPAAHASLELPVVPGFAARIRSSAKCVNRASNGCAWRWRCWRRCPPKPPREAATTSCWWPTAAVSPGRAPGGPTCTTKAT